ncbi:MAG: YIP1 family protein [Desulfarculus sp.]|nr:YIP1 family protein [Desulfarculus sp.]
MYLIARVKGILLNPKAEWEVIAGEPGRPQDLYPSYIIPLAALGPVANFIGISVVGIGVPMGGTIRIGLFGGLASAIAGFALALVLVYVVGLLIAALAPTFGAQKDKAQAFKVAAYSMTPGWLAGALNVFPGFLSILVFLISLYGIYLLYLGILALMRPPQPKAAGYTALVIVLTVVISMVFGAISVVFVR